jgi:hypothetical protein
MIWNTIAHPKMMSPSNDGTSPMPGPTPVPGDLPTLDVQGIKYADPHKLAFFDLLIDINNLKLIHGDFETVKNKILNHELVIGGGILYKVVDALSGVTIIICANISYNKDSNKILVTAFLPGGDSSTTWVISFNNTVGIDGEFTPNPGGSGSGDGSLI